MPRKVESTSDASNKRIDKAYTASFNGILKTLDAINSKLDSGKPLSDEEIRFLKNSDSLLKDIQHREKEQDQGPCILEGKLKQFIDMCEWERSIYTGDREKLFDDLGYYRCSRCGELHLKDRECAFIEYQNLTKSNGPLEASDEEEDIDLEK